MKKSIFNIYVPITSQEQADRLKQVCLDEELPIWDDELAFVYDNYFRNYFMVGDNRGKKQFFVSWDVSLNKTESTEAEFMELLKQWKDENS